VQGQLLVQQIEEYSKSHYWVSVISLESLHRFGSIAEVKRILGNLLHIVFVDVAEEERVRRQISRVGPERAEEKVLELKRKDEIKAARGALRVRDIADTVLDNHGRSEDTQKVLIQILNLLSVRKYNM
jgi:dephospho-CoA kinase